jgi:hypothetical protein
MKKNVLLAFVVLLQGALYAQKVNWAVNTSISGENPQLTTDMNSNLYQYGYFQSWHFNNPDAGTWIRKFSPGGAKIMEVHLKGSIYLTRLLNDGMGSFYFTGFFKDTIKQQGFDLVSRGKHDAVFGKMDEQGQVQWAVGFGGEKEDMAMSLTFNQDSSALVLTGTVDSTVYLYDYPIITTTKAIFLISFDLNAKLLMYKTYSFLPTQYGDNIGLEIGANASGYYLLADRMGEHWSNEPHPAGTEMEGRYVYKVDKNFNISWSSFIISSSCYYGYSCKNMAVCNNEAYVPSFCSGKYGGTGRLERLNEADGSAWWELTNHDGQYYDSHTFEGRVFFVGNEEVNGCPCQDNNPGNAKVKVVDKYNMEEIIFKQYGYHFYNITHARNGNIYVYGHTEGETPSIGGIPLEGGYFVFSLSDPTTGIRKIDASGQLLSLYPNPSQGDLKVESENTIDEITVYNLSGAAIYHVAPNSKSCSVEGLSAGCYALKVKSGDTYTTSKIVVAK